MLKPFIADDTQETKFERSVPRVEPKGQCTDQQITVWLNGQRLAAKGRSTALYYGHRLEDDGFAPATWQDLAATLPPNGSTTQPCAPPPSDGHHQIAVSLAAAAAPKWVAQDWFLA